MAAALAGRKQGKGIAENAQRQTIATVSPIRFGSLREQNSSDDREGPSRLATNTLTTGHAYHMT